jgi:hypothetical protein
MPDNARRFLSRLEVEHMEKKGRKNGELICTYDDFVEAGIDRRAIRLAIEQSDRLGFTVTTFGKKKFPNRYRLTYAKSFKGDIAETHDWRGVPTHAEAQRILREADANVEAERAASRLIKERNKSSRTQHGVSTGRERAV